MLATLYQLKEYLRALDLVSDDALLQRLLKSAEDVVIGYCGWEFEPLRATHLHDAPLPPASVGGYGGYFVDTPSSSFGDKLRLRAPLLVLEEVINGGETDPLDLAQILLFDPFLTPKYSLGFKKASGLTWKSNEGDYTQVIPVTGLWGYHERYTQAWVDTLDTLQLAVDETVTTFEVTDITGLAGDALAQRFQVGNLLKLEDEDGYEFVSIVATTTQDAPANDTLLVTRGARGTTARAWDINTPLKVYRPMEGVTQAVLEITRLQYRRKDLDAGDEKQIMGTGVKITPTTLPPYIQEMLPAPRIWL